MKNREQKVAEVENLSPSDHREALPRNHIPHQ